MSNSERELNIKQQSRPMRSSFEETTDARLNYSKPSANGAVASAKRLFSNRDSRQLEGRGENAPVQIANEDEDTPTNKRYRSAEWPLTNSQTPQDAPPSRAPLRNRNTPNPFSNGRRLSPPTRPSKFVEGSMNDRVSNKPPTPYLDEDEELVSQYDAGIGGRSSALSSRVDSNRNSIYRFGKSIASSFNPTNWKIWSKEKAEVEDEESAQARSLRESKEKAERIYRELKESGRFRDAAHISQTAYQPSQSPEKRPSAKHDSGIELGDSGSNLRYSRETSREDRTRTRVFVGPPLSHQTARRPSPALSNLSGSMTRSDTSSPSKQSFMFRKGSLSNIQSHFKKPSLSNIKRSFMGESRENLASPPTTDLHPQARRMPSRRDLHKQQKLVKRVSDLEGKLEAARRHLSDALGEPLPALPTASVERVGRSRFIPGALASLPSERLLSGYVDPDDADNNDPGFETHLGRNDSAMSGMRETPILHSGIHHPDVILRSVEIELESNVGGQLHGKRVSRDSFLTRASTTGTSDANDAGYKAEVGRGFEEISDKEATPKAPKATRPETPVRKRKSALFGVSDDGSIYKPSEDEEETDESEIKETTPTQLKEKTTANLARPSKLQKTTLNTPPSRVHPSPQNSRVSAPRVRSRPNGTIIQASARRGSVQAITMPNALPPTRKLSKAQSSATKPPLQSSNSPPSSPTFMGMKYEKLSSTAARAETQATMPSNGRVNPHNLVYSADPNTESGVPPMPPLPKNVRLANGKVISTTSSAAAAAAVASNSQAHTNHKKLTKSRTPSPTKQDNPEKKPFEWPEDVF